MISMHFPSAPGEPRSPAGRSTHEMVLAAPEQLAVPHAQLHPSTSARALPFPFNHFLGMQGCTNTLIETQSSFFPYTTDQCMGKSA